MNPYVTLQFNIPENVRRIVAVPLWGMQDPSEHRDELAYSEIFLQKQRTTRKEIHELFMPAFQQFLDGLVGDSTPGRLGESLTQMYRYFRTYDYQTTFKANDVWSLYKIWTIQAAKRGYWTEPSVFEAVQGLGWVYHFLTVLNTAIPASDMVHSSAAAFCGMIGIISKIEYGSPYILTEHGVYLREQYLSIGRSNMTPFSKRFLIGLVKAISKENLYYADELSPVCSFNGRWERVLGADAQRIRVIYNGVSSTTFHPRPPHTAIQSDSTTIPIRLLSVARIDPNKDLETLLQAVHLVHHTFGIPIQVRVQGSIAVPTYHEKILSLQHKLQLDDIIELSGHTSDMSSVYREADIVVQSSVTEAFPYSAIESMMSGVPMVATDVGGTREALGNTGILVPSRDPGKLALGIAMLAQDHELRRHLGKKARERAVQYFEISQTMASFLHLYRQWQASGSHLTAEPAGRDGSPALLAVTRGGLLAKLGEWQKAQQEMEHALMWLSNHPAAGLLLAEIANLEMKQGHLERATQHLLKARLIDTLLPRDAIAG